MELRIFFVMGQYSIKMYFTELLLEQKELANVQTLMVYESLPH